jgi:hypothetical protein
MRIKLKNSVTIHKIKNKVSLFDGETSTLYTLNDSAEFILNGLKVGWEKTRVVAGLMEKFGATKNEASEDYQKILDFLNVKELIANEK